MPTEPPTVDDTAIWDLWLAQYQLPVVLVADQLGLFGLLDEQPCDASQIGARLKLTSRAAAAIVGVLAASGFIVQRLGRYHLTDLSRAYLLESGDFYWVTMLREVGGGQILADELLERLQHENLDYDDRISRRWERGELTPDDAASSNRRMHSHSFPAALGMARNGHFAGITRLLDVGGGSGRYSIALALRYPELRCTVAELPAVVLDTERYIQRYQCQARVDTRAFNMFQDEWPSGYDAIFFSNVFHDWDPPRRAHLVARSFATLPAGGRIYLHEMLLDDSRDGPLPAALFSVMMLGTRGQQFAAAELADMLIRAGFSDVCVVHTYGYYSLVSATRPG